ncbi:MAG: hypothetical protein GX591_08225 [Planctomycetes bacterium]|nr:hypothetical protein [Planctomycetota bacterium]
MTKRQLIDDILLLNRSAKPEFLAQFDVQELEAYLCHLQLARSPRLSAVQGQYAKYFENVPTLPAAAPDAPPAAPAPQPAAVHAEEPTLFNHAAESAAS